MLLSNAVHFYAYDLLFFYNFPTVTTLLLPTSYALAMLVLAFVALAMGVCIVIAQILTFDADRIRYLCASFCFLSFVVLCQSVIFRMRLTQSKSLWGNDWLGGGLFTRFAAYVVYTLSLGLRIPLVYTSSGPGESGADSSSERHSYPDDLASGAMAIAIIAALILIVDATKFSDLSYQLLSPGNFRALAEISNLVGVICIFLHCIRRSESNDNRPESSHTERVAYDGTETLGYAFLGMSTLLEFLFYAILYDVKRIEEPLSDWMKSSEKGAADNEALKKRLSVGYSITGMAAGDDVIEEVSEQPEGSVEDFDVIIVGCGPVGLSLSCELGMRQVRTLALESRAGVVPDSRFFALSPPSVEGLKRLGVTDLLFERAIPQNFGCGAVFLTGMTQPDAEMIGDCRAPCRSDLSEHAADMPADLVSRTLSSRFAEQHMQRAMQSIQESSLKDTAEKHKSVSVRYGREVVALESTKEAVFVKFKDVESGVISYAKSRYIVGCDGPSSIVSKSVNAKFDGFVNLGQTRTILFKASGLIEYIRKSFGECLQYQIIRPGFGVGFVVLNDMSREIFTFNLIGLIDGRNPRQLSRDELISVLKVFIGDKFEISVCGDSGWYVLFFCYIHYSYLC